MAGLDRADHAGPADDDGFRSVSITEGPDGFAVDVEVAWLDDTDDAAPAGTAPHARSGPHRQSTAADRTMPADDAADGTNDDAAVDTDADTNELAIDGTAGDGGTTYSVTVTGTVERDDDASTDTSGFERDSRLPTTDTTFGIVEDGVDVLRYSGRLVELSIDGTADVRFGGGGT